MRFVRMKAHGGKLVCSQICGLYVFSGEQQGSLVMPDPLVFQYRGHESPVTSALSHTTDNVLTIRGVSFQKVSLKTPVDGQSKRNVFYKKTFFYANEE